LAAALLVINMPLVLQPFAFAHSFHREVGLVVHGQEGATHRVPHAQYLNIFRDNTTPVMWVLLIVFLAERWRERRTLKIVEWLLVAFPFAYTLALSFSPKTNDRYFLPATAMFTLFAVVGALDTGQLLRRWVPPRWTKAVLILLLLASQVVATPPPSSWKTLAEYFEAFQRDDNRELFDWVKTQLPPDAIIAKDSRILLPDPDNSKDAGRFDPLPQKIIARRYAADLGPFDAMRKRGVTHFPQWRATEKGRCRRLRTPQELLYRTAAIRSAISARPRHRPLPPSRHPALRCATGGVNRVSGFWFRVSGSPPRY
jgi:hypothetical protein